MGLFLVKLFFVERLYLLLGIVTPPLLGGGSELSDEVSSATDVTYSQPLRYHQGLFSNALIWIRQVWYGELK